ncbi:MAG TPA: DUF1858 domain-containing protein [bacterium]
METHDTVTAETRVADLLARRPEAVGILVRAGLTPLADPAHRELVKGLPVTVGMAARNHGLDLEALLRELNAGGGGAGR